MLSHGEYLADLLADLASARAARNWTAVGALQRLVGQAIGTLSQTLTVNDERFSDDELIERLALGDPELAAMLRRKLANKDAFDA